MIHLPKGSSNTQHSPMAYSYVSLTWPSHIHKYISYFKCHTLKIVFFLYSRNPFQTTKLAVQGLQYNIWYIFTTLYTKPDWLSILNSQIVSLFLIPYSPWHTPYTFLTCLLCVLPCPYGLLTYHLCAFSTLYSHLTHSYMPLMYYLCVPYVSLHTPYAPLDAPLHNLKQPSEHYD